MAWAVGFALSYGVLVPSSSAKEGDERAFEIRTLSNRADLISGGDALVEIVLPRRTEASRVRVELNGRDITHEFATRADGRFLGLVKGLSLGKNELTAALRGEGVQLLTITNYPIGGPIFSGPQVQPWICQTVEGGLGPALDTQCNAPTKVEFFYRSTNRATPASGWHRTWRWTALGSAICCVHRGGNCAGVGCAQASASTVAHTDAQSVRAQHARIIAQLEQRFLQAAQMLAECDLGRSPPLHDAVSAIARRGGCDRREPEVRAQESA